MVTLDHRGKICVRDDEIELVFMGCSFGNVIRRKYGGQVGVGLYEK